MNELIDLLCKCWIYDIQVLSDPWILFTVVPAAMYVIFMLLKWTVITAPVWIPLCFVLEVFKKK